MECCSDVVYWSPDNLGTGTYCVISLMYLVISIYYVQKENVYIVLRLYLVCCFTFPSPTCKHGLENYTYH